MGGAIVWCDVETVALVQAQLLKAEIVMNFSQS